MAEELKACPFCGSVPELEKVGRDWWRVRHLHAIECILDEAAFDYPQTEEDLACALSDWNTRAQLPSQGCEAVAWQAGFIESGDAWNAWQTCSKEHHDFVKRCPNEWPDYEVRPLYTHPADQVAGGVVVSRELLWRADQLLSQYFTSAVDIRAQLRALLNGGQE